MFKLSIIKNPTALLILALVVVGFFVYSFNLNNKLFWDDDDWIINNNFVHEISWSNTKFWFTHDVLAGVGLKSNYYRPFLFFTFASNYMVAGIKPLIYHLTSNFIHIFNGVLVFWFLRRVFKRNLLAFLVSVIFLIHPLQTEAITYISGRGDALVAMFMLLALILFHRAETKNEDWWSVNKILSLCAIVLGLLSRETGIVFPILALVFYVSVLSKQKFIKSIREGLIKTWPYFLLVLVYGILRLTSLNFLDTLNFYKEPNLYSENLHVRLFTFLPILWEYLKLLVVPAGLHMERGGVVYDSLFKWPVWPMFLVLIGLLAWLGYLYKKNIQSFKIWIFGLSWFFIALGPVSGITPINALMYEHWLYLPMIGFWLIVSFYLVKLFDFLKSRKLSIFYFLLSAFLIAYFSFFTYQSIQRNLLWGNQIEFYKDILKYEPLSLRINNNLGNAYYNNKDIEQAEFYYKKAVESDDTFAQPYFNLGTIVQTRGDINGAIKLYEKAIEINPAFFYAYQNLAGIYAQRGNLIKASENLEKLKSIIPDNPRVYYNSALIYAALNNKIKALEDIQRGLLFADTDHETEQMLKALADRINK